MSSIVPFGAPMKNHFLIDPNYRNLNHGSFGTYPRAVQTALRALQDQAESRPDEFIRRTQIKQIDEARQDVAALLNVPVTECVFVKNATTGVNTVLHNLVFQPGDVVVYFDTIYGAVEKSLVALFEKTPLKGRKVSYQFPISPDELVARFRDTIRQAKADGLNPRVGLFDTIVSNPGFRLPFEQLVQLCRDEGVLSLVDGAHGIGHIPLDLGTLQPDFFTSNLHKWLFTPRGCAVLYVPLRNQHHIRTTLPTSWGFIPLPHSPATAPSTMKSADPKSPFEYLFEFVATSDDTPYQCVSAALAFRRDVCGGEAKITQYLEDLANEGAEIISARLGTEIMQEAGVKSGERSLFRKCAMTNVRLPVAVSGSSGLSESQKQESVVSISEDDIPGILRSIQETLFNKYGTFVPVFRYGGSLWTRLSAQVYLEKSDFEWLGGVLEEVVAGIKRKEGSAKL